MAVSLASERETKWEMAPAPRPQMPRGIRVLFRNRLLPVGLLLAVCFTLVALAPGLFTRQDPYRMDFTRAMQGPSAAEWMGTDHFGRSIFARVVYGSRASLGVAFASVAIAATVGTLAGIVSGYVGGWTDQLLGRVMDVFFSFPTLLLAVVVAGILGPSVTNVILTIAIVYTPYFFRVVRGPMLAERERDYVQAAYALGLPAWRIMFRHLLPNVVTPVIVQASVTLCYAILLEASLSYLGLGIQPPHPSWGSILNEGRPYLQLTPWFSVFPGLVLMLAVLAFNLIGDGLRDLWDQRTQGSR